jgi:hypothetical protein
MKTTTMNIHATRFCSCTLRSVCLGCASDGLSQAKETLEGLSETLSKDGPVNLPSLDADMMLRILDLASDIACWSHTFAHDCRFDDSAMGTHTPADAQKV